MNLALASLLLVACGQATSAPAADDPDTTPTPTPTPTSSTTRPLGDFPLTRGYPEHNGDDGSPVVVTEQTGLGPLTFCDRPAWSMEVPAVPADSVGTTYTGEAEDFRARTLVRYDDEALAAQALAALRLAVEECPEGEIGGTAQVYTGSTRHTGDEAFTITHRYRSEYGFDTGLEVIDLVRVGDLLFLSSEYGEGGGSDESIRRGRRQVTDQSDELLPWLCEYAVPACAVREPVPVIEIGPDGVGDLTLGMSAEDAAKAGYLGEPRHDGSGCTVVWRDDESGAYAVTADTRPDAGVVDISATTDSVTPEGVGTGSTAEDVLAAYPDATGDGSRKEVAVPGHPERAYWFWFGDDGLIFQVALLLRADHCRD